MKTFLKKVFNRFLRSSDLFQETQNRLDMIEQNIGGLVYRTGAIHSDGEKVTDVALDKVSLQALYTEILRTQEAIQATQGMVIDSIRANERVAFLVENLAQMQAPVNNYIEYCAKRDTHVALKNDKQMLCERYSNFNDKILELVDMAEKCQWVRFPQSLYHYFIQNQDKLSYICGNLDEESNNVLYRQLFLWCVTPLMFRYDVTPPPPAWNRKWHLDTQEMIDEFIHYRWRALQNAKSSDIFDEVSYEEHYLLDEEHVKKGFYIIDGGAFCGETAIVMSKLVGPTGRVFAFEPVESAYKVLCSQNLENTVCIPKGLHDQTKELAFHIVEGDEFSSSVRKDGEIRIAVTSIDDYVSEQKLSRVDFIKMDIEGSELSALKGAKNTIVKFKPMLAISIYHNDGRDLIDVTHYLMETYKDQYKFSIRQNSICWSETVVFATRR